MRKEWGAKGGIPRDRTSPRVARRIVEQLLPESGFRKFALGVMTEVLNDAVSSGEKNWSATLFRRRARLNGGTAWIFDIGEGMLGIPIKENVLTGDTVHELGDRVSHWREADGAWVTIKPGDEHFWPKLRDASRAWVSDVTKTRATRPARAHSPGLVRYLEQETGHTFDDEWQSSQRETTADRRLDELLGVADQLHPDQFADAVADAAKERDSIRARFPEESWPTMRLEDYALGQPGHDETFSKLLEYRSPNLGGIGGGGSRKHGVFFSPTSEEWRFGESYPDVQTAWAEIRRGFVELLEFADQEQWVEVDETSPIPAMVRLKTLFVYRPESVLPIYSKSYLRFFLENLGVSHSETTGLKGVSLNRRLLGLLRSQPELAKWSNLGLARVLYEWKDPRETRAFLKVAPGEDAQLWDTCLENQCMLVGWPKVGDLQNYDSKDELRRAFEQYHGPDLNDHSSTIARIVNDLWAYRNLEPGDQIVANRGQQMVLAVGEVEVPGYEFSGEFGDHPHAVSVSWDTSYERSIPRQPAWRNTIKRKMPVSLQLKILERSDSAEPVLPPPPEYETISQSLDHKGQAVLFGPPGTGKTYVARRFALWWAGEDGNSTVAFSNEKEFAKLESTDNAQQGERRTWLVIANPRRVDFEWSDLRNGPEEFYEGNIKRNFPMVKVGDLVVGYEAGVDKCIKAIGRVKERFRETDRGRSFQIEHLVDVDDGPTFHELRADDLLKESEGVRQGCRGTLFSLNEEESAALFDLIEEKNPDVRKYLEQESNAPTITRVTFHPSYAYEDFVEGFRPVDSSDGTLRLKIQDGVFKRVCREALVAPERRFLLLIDELNRGNVAKIFGELITLLERDKRGMVVTLPQSKEPFQVPPNVYILATMNTADRSLRHLDAALRRRFQFIEMLPDSELLAGYMVRNLSLADFLDSINEQIVKTFGREKQVGHSFLMRDGEPIVDEEQFAFRFRYEILPLIQEYCYDDFRQLQKFFGKTLVDVQHERFNEDALSDPTQLLNALEKHFGSAQNLGAE